MYCVHGVAVVKHAQISKLVQLRLTGDLIQLTLTQSGYRFFVPILHRFERGREGGNAGMRHLKKPILDLNLLYVEQID